MSQTPPPRAVFAIIAAVQSYQGVAYRYPLTIRLVT
jgi:uncharacterized Tic20 family protein